MQLQSTSKVQARLRIVVEKLKAFFYTLDPHANRSRPIPYEMGAFLSAKSMYADILEDEWFVNVFHAPNTHGKLPSAPV